jgi:hypothetical protein
VKSGNRVSSKWGIGDVINDASIGTSTGVDAAPCGRSFLTVAAPDGTLAFSMPSKGNNDIA